uniref:histidine kinase n=1 Tax=uncultured bacterium Contig16 TaxID=1393468 RepID=W0FLX5_9BACT|nr:signal transduction histidine kinase LytS [uncultured bacterium Contig16]
MRLLLLILATVLPLNILVIGLSGWRLSALVKEQRELHENELSLSMSILSDGMDYIGGELDAFVQKHRHALQNAEREDLIESYEMIRELRAVFEHTALTGNVSLQHRKSHLLYMLFTPQLYTAREAEDIRYAVKESDLVTTRGWVIRTIAGRYYYMRNYQFDNYTVSFRIDIADLCLRQIFDNAAVSEALFTDGRDVLLILPDGSTERLLAQEKLDGGKEGGFLWEDTRYGCRLQMKSDLPRSGTMQFIYFALALVVFFVLLLSGALWIFLYAAVMKPLRKLQDAMHEIENGRQEFRITDRKNRESAEFVYVYDSFNRMADEVEASHEKDMKMIRAELDNLRLQVNPHMLLNSFNTIFSLAQSKNTALIQDFSLYLVDYFRYVLKESADLVPLEKEMAFVESYTGIQKIRFPNRFTSVYSMSEKARTALVPPLLVENFVENAMKYALIPGKMIEVLINARVENGRLLISIADTGRGFKEEALESVKSGEVYVDAGGHRHIGIWNCRRRMEVFYGDSASMNITSTEGSGTQIFLDLPYRPQEKNASASPAFDA